MPTGLILQSKRDADKQYNLYFKEAAVGKKFGMEETVILFCFE
jgi:hypothetical protein